MRLAVLCASYNRAETTIKGLTGLWAILSTIPGIEPQLFLLDDASPDGTAALVRKAMPNAVVVDGNGRLFWNRGMRAAYGAARSVGGWDAYLIFNDDALLEPEGVRALFETYSRLNIAMPTACVGYFSNLAGTARTYGGYLRGPGFSPLSLIPVAVTKEDRRCDTFNGNFVLIPARQLEAIDPFPSVFHHQFGDIDIGYGLGRLGVQIIECAAPVGRCDRNPAPDNTTLSKRWKNNVHPPHGLAQYVAFMRRNVPFPYWLVIAALGLLVRMVRILVGSRD